MSSRESTLRLSICKDMPSIQLDEFFLLAEEDSGQSVGRVSLSFLEVGSASAVVLSHPMMRRSITTIRSASVLTFILLHHFNSTLCVVSASHHFPHQDAACHECSRRSPCRRVTTTEPSACFIYQLTALTCTYDHRTLKIELPVRSAVLKQCTGGLVVRWVTTSEYPLLYVFTFLLRVRRQRKKEKVEKRTGNE
jgi:hypothetical protein